MFKIEWLLKGAVIEREESALATIEAVLQDAIGRVRVMKSRFHPDPPDSFRIIDSKGLLVTSVILVRPGDGTKRFR